MSKTIFKINSQTHKDAMHKKGVIEKIMLQCGISYEVWASILFETGCRFIEDKITILPLQKALLQNSGLRFWDWWIMQFLTDDEWILDCGLHISELQYRREKTRMSLLMITEENFQIFLNKTLSREKI